jgi:formylglycine-generating enzyme required for sulfatase activity
MLLPRAGGSPPLLLLSYVGAPSDGSPWTSGTCDRVARGGSFQSDANSLRSAARGFGEADRRYSDSGFRVARLLLP